MSRMPFPNSLGTKRSGQPSLLASSQVAVNVERLPPSAPARAVTFSNSQVPLMFPLLRHNWFPSALPLLPDSHESARALRERVT